MVSSQKYVLVLGQEPADLDVLEALLDKLRFPVTIASSENQAMVQASQARPCLVILAGNHRSWSQALMQDLRNTANTCGITIVALTDSHTPSWLRQEENPGFDGFLVKPVSGDVLTSLVQSAWARQTCFSTH